MLGRILAGERFLLRAGRVAERGEPDRDFGLGCFKRPRQETGAFWRDFGELAEFRAGWWEDAKEGLEGY